MEELTSLVEEATSYFQDDFNSDIWQNLTDSEKNGAIKVSILDVKSILIQHGEVFNLNSENIRMAIFEQAIFLAIQKLLLNSDNQINNQSINGIGSTSYFKNSDAKDFYLKKKISPRTLALLKNNKKIITIIR